MDIKPDTPVLVGHGTAGQRESNHLVALDAAGLMTKAARTMLTPDMAGPVLPQVDWIGATAGLTSYPDPARLVAQAIGAPDAHTVLANVGVMQQTLVSRACSLVQSGEAVLALVVGGEARYRDVRAAAAGEKAAQTPQAPDVRPDEVLSPAAELVLRCEAEAGLRGAPAFYALIESERRAKRGQSPEENRQELGALYARFSEIAADNAHAVRRAVRRGEDLKSASPDNPMVAFPYTKLMITTWTVDQAAALLFCNAATAKGLGFPRESWLFPLVAAESNHTVPVTARKALTQPQAMAALARACTRASGIEPSRFDLLDLYSCFPVAATVAAEGLGVSPGRDLTITGGMSFAGGPYNNYFFQALCRAAELLDGRRGTTALVSCVSGLYTKQGFTVLSSEPPARPFSVQDVTAEVSELEPALPVEERPNGYGAIAASTVLYKGQEPERAVAVIDLPDGHRTVARCSDPDVMNAFVTTEPVGRTVSVADGLFRFAAR